MSTLSEKSLCISEDKDAQERNSETRTKRKRETQKYERSNLSYNFAKKICPSEFRSWPILGLLNPEFIMQIHMIMVYGNCGNRTLIVTKDKNVYVLDHNKDYHSNIGDTNIGLYPRKIEELCGKSIKTFARNSNYCVALTEEGEVYCWTFFNENKFLFTGLCSPTLLPMGIPVIGLSEKCIVDIACGSDHFLALTNDGKVYAWGENKYGQIGNGEESRFHHSQQVPSPPRQVKNELEGKKVVHIACGSMFNMVITDKGKLYGWGDNEKGQILIDTMKGQFGSRTTSSIDWPECYAHPREITALSGKVIVKVACGFEHTLALTDEGKLYAWGKNDRGQVGVNNNLKISIMVMVNLPGMRKVLDIAAYGTLSVAVGSNKTVYVWGDCFNKVFTTPFPTGLSRIHDAFAYSTGSIMHKPLIVSTNNDVDEVFNLLESLGTLFDDPSTSDFTVQVEGQRIHVHKAILKIRCQHFKNKFEHDWAENGESIPDPPAVYVPDKFSYIVYKAFLKYLYTGTVDLPSEKLLELMKLADEYCEANLKRECDQIIKQAITVSNVAFFYNKAIEFNAKEFEEFCFQFALCHMKDVILSEEYIQLDISVRNKFIHRAAKENAFRT